MSASMMRGTPVSVWVLRVVLAASLVLALLAGVPQGYTPSVFVVVVVVIGALLSMIRPEHLGVSVTMGLVIAWWAVQLRSEMPVAVLVVAAALVVAHVAATLLGYGPPTLPLDPALAVLWVTRGVMVWTAGLAVWVVARAYDGHGSPALFWLVGLTAALVGAIAAGVTTPIRGKESRR